MSRENPLWGAERIRGELLKLGLVVSNRSIRRYRRRGPTGRPSQTWRTFLANHRPRIWAADLFTVQSLTFKTLYVFFFIAHGRRELLHVNVTASPTAAWAWRQMIEATPWGRRRGTWSATATPLSGATSYPGPPPGDRDAADADPRAAGECGRRTSRADLLAMNAWTTSSR